MKTQKAWTATHKHNNELVIIEGSDECLCSLSELGLQFSISTSEQIVPARLVYGADSIAEFEEMREDAEKYRAGRPKKLADGSYTLGYHDVDEFYEDNPAEKDGE